MQHGDRITAQAQRVLGAADLVARFGDRLADLGTDDLRHLFRVLREQFGEAMEQALAFGRRAEAEGAPGLARGPQRIGDRNLVGDFDLADARPGEGVEHVDHWTAAASEGFCESAIHGS